MNSIETPCPLTYTSQAFIDSGIPVVGKLPWGTHFCEFFDTFDDLTDILTPYFKTGLDNNDLCIWINHDEINSVRTALLNTIPNMAEHLAQGRMLFFEREICFKNACAETAAPLLANLLELEKRALEQGFRGLRIAGGPTNFSSQRAKNDFLCFENQVCAAFHHRQIIALCCYKTGECDSKGIFDVIKSHQFALLLQDGQWEMVENATIKLLKEELHKQNESLEMRVRERTNALEEALKSRDHFLSIASHELKTPITALRLYVDGLVLKDKAYIREHVDEFMQFIHKIKEQSFCLETLINKLLDITTVLNQQCLPIEPQYFNLSLLMETVVERYTKKWEQAGCEINARIHPEIYGAWDPVRIEQILVNLITNSIKYAPGSPIMIALTKDQWGATLEIRDEGQGIAKSKQKQIFDRYVQLGSKKSQGGLGLGLWIVRQIVLAHHGEISLQSALGKGCHFRIHLPFSQHSSHRGGRLNSPDP
ncbi:ATP-binding protein [Legionella sp. MW5194]|uniref:ATP-binding protein n=1 Tax=Legionella sp. MW5194 TaxID=2662448 RepID=UPI00193D5DDB|nr:ATP-binding protein [Legionella sp. MW5194]